MNIKSLGLICILLLTKNVKAQINLTIPPSPSRLSIEDFYGLNGQNTLTTNSDYFNSQVRFELNQSRAAYLRYPGGTVANYWDWQEGWFFRNLEKNGALSLDVNFQNKPRITEVFNSGILNTSGSNYITDFKNTLAFSATKPLFVLNPILSDLNYQIAMLLEAKLQNLEVKRVEIGNELYLSTESYQEKFATPQDYANLSMQWSVKLKDYLGNDLQVCVVGSNNDYKGNSTIRRSTWNSGLINTISSSLPDAFSIHHYRETGITNFTNSTNDYNTIFQNAINNFNDLNNSINQLSTNNATPIWITEYNLFDNSVPIHGTWCHGLYTALSTLKFLENNRITACNLHAQSGNYVFGNFYNTNDGLDQSGNFQTIFPNTNSNPTTIYGKTSEGIAMEQISIALKNAISGSKINFNSAVPNNIPTLLTDQALYGWTFNDNGSNNASSIILNLSNATLANVNVSNLGITAQSELIQISCSNPALYANGVSTISANSKTYTFIDTSVNAQLVAVTSQNIPANNFITLPPYSITRIKKNLNWRPRLFAQNDTIIAGSKLIVTLLNKDTIPYNWGNGNDSATYIEIAPTADTTISINYSISDSSSTYIVSKFIKVIQTPVAVTINASATSYCPGTAPINLGAIAIGGNSNYKYIWITTPTDDEFPDFNKGVGDSQSILVSPDYPTTYTVYVTDGTTVAKASITINVPTAFNLEPSYTACSNTDLSINIAAKAQTGVSYNYTWQGSNYTISSTFGNPVNFTITRPNISTSEFVTVNVSNAGCTTAKQAIVNFYDCCSTSLIQINPGADLNDLETLLKNNSSYNLTKANGGLKIQCNGNSLIVNGDFHVNDFYDPTSSFITDLELESCNLAFTEGASITVEPGFALTLNNSNLDAACSQMWKGIIVNAGTLTTEASNLNGTSIKNAEIAINSYPGSTLNLRRTKFENNLVGIEADHQSIDGDNLQLLNIKANEFRGIAGAMKSPYIGQSLPMGNIPYTGMLFKLINSEIGVPISEGAPNKFFNLNAGIICFNSTINIQNCKFFDMESDNAYMYPAGFSIFALDNSTINGNDLDMEKTQISSSPSYGILQFQGANLNIQKSTFNNLDRAIQNDWSNFKNYNISENLFTDCKTGIEWWESSSIFTANIANNYFGASIDQSGLPVQQGMEAIHIWGGNYNNFPLRINSNVINDHLIGIYAIGLNGKEYEQYINDNKINLSITADNVFNNGFDFRGISLQQCDYLNVINNEVTWSDIRSRFDTNVEGIRFEFCKTSLFSLNTLMNLDKGFYIAGTCEETNLTCNEINKCYPNGIFIDGADLSDQGSIGHPNFNTFIGTYDPIVNSFLKLAGNVNGNQINWYFQGQLIYVNSLFPEPSSPNIVLAQQTYNNGTFSCSNAERYMGNMEQRIEYLDKIIADSLYYTLYPMENRLFDLEYAHTIMEDDSSLIINSVYEQFFQALDQGNIGKLNEVRRLLNDGHFNLAVIKNNTVLYQNVMEQNAKAVNDIVLNKLIQPTIFFDSTQNSLLANIAYQPAILGGKGVYNARSLLKLRIEDGPSSLRKGSTNSIKKPSTSIFTLYPNPSNDFFKIKTNNDEPFNLIIKDTNGKVLFEKFSCTKNTEFSTLTLSSGIYLLDLHLNNGEYEKIKLAIIH